MVKKYLHLGEFYAIIIKNIVVKLSYHRKGVKGMLEMRKILIIALAIFLVGQWLIAGDVDKNIKKAVEKDFKGTSWNVIIPLYNQIGLYDSEDQWFDIWNCVRVDGVKYWSSGIKDEIKDNNLERFWQKYVAKKKIKDDSLSIAISEAIVGRTPKHEAPIKYRELALVELETGIVVEVKLVYFHKDKVRVRVADEWENYFSVVFDFNVKELSKQFEEREQFEQMWTQIFEKIDK